VCERARAGGSGVSVVATPLACGTNTIFWDTMRDEGFLEFSDDEPWMPIGDEHWMRHAMELAEQAAAEDEVPVGALIVQRGRVIASAYNQREQLADPTAHAEMIAITQAAAHLNSWRLLDCELYVTLEPCPMCAGAILQARIPRVVYGAIDTKAGAVDSLYRLLNDDRLNHRCEVVSGVLAKACGRVLTEFFERKRKLGKK
jgi:tRNA(adenine34) deaminase